MTRTKKYNEHNFDPFFHGSKIISAIDDLEDEIISIQKNVEIKKYLQDLSYPYGLKSWINSEFLSPKNSHRIFLSNIRFQHKSSLPQIRLRNSYDDSFFVDTSLKIRSGLEYLDYAEKSSELINPTLYYYGVIQIYSAIIQIYLDFPNYNKRSHGIKANGKWEILLTKGLFEKIVAFLDIVFHSSSIFSNAYWDSPFNLIREDDILLYQGHNVNIYSLNLFFEKHSNYKENYYLNSRIGLHLLNLFYFSHYSRYCPVEWAEIQRGNHFMYLIYKKTIRDVGLYIQLIFESLLRFIPCVPNQESNLKQIKNEKNIPKTKK